MDLEFAAEEGGAALPYPVSFVESGRFPLSTHRDSNAASGLPGAAVEPARVLDWQPMMEAILADLAGGVPVSRISSRFHRTLSEAILKAAAESGNARVILTGGCFQNRRLTELAVEALSSAGFRPYWHQRIPPNDGGISLGQVVAAAWQLRDNSDRSASAG
jgi:hydrogenase maturation protein HypF